MAQIKIYGLASALNPIKERLSNVIHDCSQEVLSLPEKKRFHRFITLNRDEFYYPRDRSEKYIILEIYLLEDCSIDVKKKLMRTLMKRIHEQLRISLTDIEIMILDIPSHNWGIRGKPGDELQISYNIDF